MTFCLSLCAQEQTRLSEAGARSWKAAMTLLDMAKTVDELEGTIREFEKVTKSDPNYADTYFNLGKLYTRYGKEKGPQYFDMAHEYFSTYIRLRPDDKKAAEDEIYIMNAIKENSVSQWPLAQKAKYYFAPFEGLWEGDGAKIQISYVSTCPEDFVKYRFEYVECRITSYNGNSIEDEIWDSSTDAVRSPARLQYNPDNIDSVPSIHWEGKIHYNSRSSANRYAIREYEYDDSYSMDCDSEKYYYYRATIKDGKLYLKCYYTDWHRRWVQGSTGYHSEITNEKSREVEKILTKVTH